MKYENLDGIDPEKLSEQELYYNIIEWSDFTLATDCYSVLASKNEDLAIKATEVVLNYSKDSFYYGDDYFQATFFGFLSNRNEEKAIEYISNNYQRVDPIVFEKMLLHVMYFEDEKTKDLKSTLKQYCNDRKDDKEFWEDIKSRSPYEGKYVEDFLKSFGNSEQQIT